MNRDWGKAFSNATSVHLASIEEQRIAHERREQEIQQAVQRARELRAIMLRKVAEYNLDKLLAAYRSGSAKVGASIGYVACIREELREFQKLKLEYNHHSMPRYTDDYRTYGEVAQIMNQLLNSPNWSVKYIGRICGGEGAYGGEEFCLVTK